MIPITRLLAQTRELLATDLSSSIEDGNTVHAVCIGKDGKVGNYAVTGTFLGWLLEAAQQGQDRDCLTREEGDHLREQLVEATAAAKAVNKAKRGSLPNSGCSHPGCQCPSCQILILRDLLATATEERDQARDLHSRQAFLEKGSLNQQLDHAHKTRIDALIERDAARAQLDELVKVIANRKALEPPPPIFIERRAVELPQKFTDAGVREYSLPADCWFSSLAILEMLKTAHIEVKP